MCSISKCLVVIFKDWELVNDVKILACERNIMKEISEVENYVRAGLILVSF